MKHKWDPNPARTQFLTTRVCTKCGLQKITHHEGPQTWIEWKRDEATIPGTKTPPCEAVEGSDAAA